MPDFILPDRNTGSAFSDMRGHHVAVRVQEFEVAKRGYVEKLDARVVHEWPYADEQLAYLALPNDDHFMVELLGGGDPPPATRQATPTSARVRATPATTISASAWPISRPLWRS